MRWFVEVSRVGELESDENYCVEAKQWQAALQEARRLRGDSGPLSKFSIELLDDGYRAVDPKLKVRYLVHQAPLDAPLTPVPDFAPPTRGYVNGQSTAPSRSSNPPPMPAAEAPSAPNSYAASAPPAVPSRLPPLELAVGVLEASPKERVSSLPPRPTKAPESPSLRAPVGLVVPADAVPRAPAVPRGLVADGGALPAAVAGLAALASPPKRAASQAPPPPAATVLRRRGEEPTPDSPITYREVAYQVAPGVTRAEVEALLMVSLRELQSQLATRPSQKFVQLAVFDHEFERRPERPPLGTLRWKDWRGAPVLTFPQFDGPPLFAASSPPPSFGPPPGSLAPARPSVLPSAPPRAPSELPSLPPRVASALPTSASVAPLQGASLPTQGESANSPAGKPLKPSVPVVIRARAGSIEPPPPPPPPEPASGPEAAPFPLRSLVPAAAPFPLVAAAPEAEPFELGARPSVAPAPPVSVTVPAVSAPPAPAESLAKTVISSPEAAVLPPSPEPEVEPAPPPPPPPPPPAASLPQSPTPVPPSRDRSSRPRLLPVRRRVGEDLISELFETMHDLHFMPDVAAGTDFALAALETVLPAEGVLIHAFDINSSQFVVVRAHGPSAERALLHRSADTDLPFSFVMRRPGATVFDDTSRDGRALGKRWDLLGVAPRALLLAPVRKAGRYLGLIEVANPLGDAPFHSTEQNAVDYVGEQLAEFLANRPLVFEPEVILRP